MNTPTTRTRWEHNCRQAHYANPRQMTSDECSNDFGMCREYTRTAVKVRRFKRRPGEIRVDWKHELGWGSSTWEPEGTVTV